jgi:hypothetical protein
MRCGCFSRWIGEGDMIVLPMAGLSRRFTEAGYAQPKYMLQAGGRSLFAHAVSSFERYFATTPFLFIARDVQGTPDFVRREAAALGIAQAQVVTLAGETRGQAETVALGLRAAKVNAGEAVTVFNIDTMRAGFAFPEMPPGCAGFLEVFRGSGSNWSYVLPEAAGSDRVVRTTETEPISDLCCTGLYHFAEAGGFLEAFDRYAIEGAGRNGPGELYVAPVYNLIIAGGGDVRYTLIPREDVTFFGVPAEYEAFRARFA